MRNHPLFEKLEAVHDRESFLAFVDALAVDREQAYEGEKVTPDPYCANGWQNKEIHSFLAAAIACAASTGTRHGGWFPAEPSWKAFAEFLWTGKIYE